MSDLVNQQLGNYRLLRLLGIGGFGDVYLGEHIHLGTQSAIKVVQARFTRDDAQSFLQEARTIARLDHPNIVRILEFGVDPATNIPFLVMTYAPNGTVRQRHPRGSRVPLDQVVVYVRQLAGALQYAHSQKFIHRDIKPENFLLGRNEEVLLSDFGTALLTQSSHSQSTKNIAGTAAYMSPEQLQGKPVAASDQYSLGVAVYEWLSGECPFQGSFIELYSQHLNVAPVPLHKKVPGLSQDVAQVVHQALAKETRFRFPDMQSFANAFIRASEPTLLMSPVPYFQQVFPGQAPVSQASSFPQTSSQATIQPAGLSSADTYSPVLPTPARPLPSSHHAQASNSTPVSGSQEPLAGPGTPPVYPQPGLTTPGGRSNDPGASRSPRRVSSRRTIGILAILTVIILLIVVVGANVLSYLQTGRGSSANHSSQSSGVNSTTVSSVNPTPSPTPLTPGTLIYQATFDQSDFGNWSGDNSLQWKLVGNGEIGSDGTGDGQSNGGFIIWYQHDMPVQNYAVEAKIQFVRSTNSDSGFGSDEFGIMVRGDGNMSGYEGGMQIVAGNYCTSEGGAIISLVRQDGTSSCDGSNSYLKKVAYTLDENVHTYLVEVKGDSIQLFLDGQAQPVLSTTDNTLLQPGRVGLRSVYADINVLSFKVTAL